VVLGHSSCGAVSASQNTLRTGEYPGGDIDDIVNAILPAIEDLPKDQTLAEGIWANAAYSARSLKQSSIIRNAIESGKLRVKYATYDLKSRRATFA
jgi:carbonic anhydrase